MKSFLHSVIQMGNETIGVIIQNYLKMFNDKNDEMAEAKWI